MLKEFKMSNLGRLSYFLGIEFSETESGIVMHQSRFAFDMLKRFDMLNNIAANTPTKVGL